MSEPEPDPSIPDTSVVYRRVASAGDVNMLGWDEGTGERYVKSGAFKFDADGCSVHRDQPLADNGMTYMDVIRAPQNVVLGIEVGRIRDRDMGVRDTPWPSGPEPEAPYQVAHASVLRGDIKDRPARRALAAEAQIVHWPASPTDSEAPQGA